MADLEDILSIAGVSPGDADASGHDDLQELIDMGGPGVTPVAMPPPSPASPERSALADIVDAALAEPPPTIQEQVLGAYQACAH